MNSLDTPQFNPSIYKVAYINKLTGEVAEKSYQAAVDTDLLEMQVNEQVFVVMTGVSATVSSEMTDSGEYAPVVNMPSPPEIPVTQI